MSHQLEIEYQLSAEEILDAIAGRFRLKVALEGRVAEVHLGKHIDKLKNEGVLLRAQEHDRNGFPDFTVWPRKRPRPLVIECKSARSKGFTQLGRLVAHRVETQKTRAAKSDPSSRLYDVDYFDVLAVCLGKLTHNWSDFLFVKSVDLPKDASNPGKLAVMHRVPLSSERDIKPWFRTLQALVESL